MREIVLDTETTGFDPSEGHRLVEIGCVELFNHMPTGRTYHQYINPERDMPAEAFAVHGLSEDFLRAYPTFDKVADEFLAFVNGATLVIHNAAFDMRFLNAELSWINKPLLPEDKVVDTLLIARRKFPGSPASLDALCRRFGIDNSNRTLHGALLDSEILAEVYLELIGGRQPDFALTAQAGPKPGSARTDGDWRPRPRPTPLPPRLTQAEAEAHAAFVKAMGDKAIWRRYDA
ncbi:MAG: DNA polymerase III subunit epsilon [Pararhodobacter sp.]